MYFTSYPYASIDLIQYLLHNFEANLNFAFEKDKEQHSEPNE